MAKKITYSITLGMPVGWDYPHLVYDPDKYPPSKTYTIEAPSRIQAIRLAQQAHKTYIEQLQSENKYASQEENH